MIKHWGKIPDILCAFVYLPLSSAVNRGGHHPGAICFSLLRDPIFGFACYASYSPFLAGSVWKGKLQKFSETLKKNCLCSIKCFISLVEVLF
jgi:hypothetical protein